MSVLAIIHEFPLLLNTSPAFFSLFCCKPKLNYNNLRKKTKKKTSETSLPHFFTLLIRHQPQSHSTSLYASNGWPSVRSLRLAGEHLRRKTHKTGIIYRKPRAKYCTAHLNVQILAWQFNLHTKYKKQHCRLLAPSKY